MPRSRQSPALRRERRKELVSWKPPCRPRLLSRPLIPLPRSCRNTRAAARSSATRQPRRHAILAFSAKRNGRELNPLASRSGQKPFSRNMIELQSYSVGILEQQRIISRRPLILAWRANDGCAERTQEAVQFINVGALAGAKAEMVQADAILLEHGSCMLGGRRVDPDRGATADAVKAGVAVDHRLQPKKRQQLTVEFARALEIGRGQKNMRDAVDFHLAPFVTTTISDKQPLRIASIAQLIRTE